MRRAARLWAPVILWAVMIFVLSSYESPLGIRVKVFGFDKAGHAAIYGVLAFLIARAFTGRAAGWSGAKIFFAAVVLTFLYGVSDELHQTFVPGRDGNVADAIFDLIGACAGAYLYRKNN